MNRMMACFLGIGITLLLLPALGFGSQNQPAPSIAASVVGVVDANTVVVRILSVLDASPVSVGDTVHIHLVGLELTQSGQAFWEENSDAAIDNTVYLEIDPASASSWRGGDEPLSAYVYLDPEGKTLADSLLISMGFAVAVTSSAIVQTSTSVATSESQAESSTSTSADVSASSAASSQSNASSPTKSTGITTIPQQPGGCCCGCACQTPGPIAVLDLTSCVRQGDYAKLEIEAVPGAWYKIEVGYPPYLSSDLDLSPRRASCGVLVWLWKVYPQTPPGTWPITVIARLDGKIIGRLDASITVRR